MDLSLVIVNWNTRELLRACLASVPPAAAGSGLQWETIVVDNASTDGSAEMVRAEFPEARLFANTENRNYAGGNNQGLRAAAGDFLLLLNPDTELPPGSLGALVEELRAHPDWGALAPALVHPDGRPQDSVRGFPTPQAIVGELTGLARLLPHSPWAGYRARALPADQPSLVDQPMASAFLLRKAALDQIGLFDEAFPLFFNDVDLCYRLKEAGWQIAYDPRVRVVHHGGASTRQVRPEAIRKSHAGLVAFYAKHYGGRIAKPVYTLLIWSIQLTGWLRAMWAGIRSPGRR